MLEIFVPEGPEYWDEQKEEFVTPKTKKLALEHSLVSISKWESKWNKPFLSSEKTNEEVLDYIRCMTLNSVNPKLYLMLTTENVTDIQHYIESPMTATTFSNLPPVKNSSKTVTSELIYYWMIALNIPFECQKWHLNRLLTLIQVAKIESSPPKQMGREEMLAQRRAINEKRKAALNSNG